jgi:hypothetical protein
VVGVPAMCEHGWQRSFWRCFPINLV